MMMTVDIGDYRLCLEIPTGRARIARDRWRCVQARNRRPAAWFLKRLKYGDNETDEPTVPDIRVADRFRLSCSIYG
jgi:hypothetical protein